MRVLEGVRERYEQFHQIRYGPGGAHAAVEQSGATCTDRFFRQAIDVLDEAGARVKLAARRLDRAVAPAPGRDEPGRPRDERAVSAKDFEARCGCASASSSCAARSDG